MKTNASTKITEFPAILNMQFKGKLNLASVKFISPVVCLLCKVQTVTF